MFGFSSGSYLCVFESSFFHRAVYELAISFQGKILMMYAYVLRIAQCRVQPGWAVLLRRALAGVQSAEIGNRHSIHILYLY